MNGFASFVLVCSLVFSSLQVVCAQNLRKGGGGGRRQPISNRNQANSFTVGYPMGILSDTDKASNDRSWRDSAIRSQELYDLSEDGKPYAYLAKAQDQEDIWLYENWFYGLKGKERHWSLKILCDTYSIQSLSQLHFLVFCRGSDHGIWSAGWQTVLHFLHVREVRQLDCFTRR